MEYEFWVKLSMEDSSVLLEKLGLTGLAEKEATPIVKEKIPESRDDFTTLCESFGLKPSRDYWVTTDDD